MCPVPARMNGPRFLTVRYGPWLLAARRRRGNRLGRGSRRGGRVQLVLGAVGGVADVAAGLLHRVAGFLDAALDGIAGLFGTGLDLVAGLVQVVADRVIGLG